MIAKILGWILVILGVLFLIKPGFLKKKLAKKSTKTIKKYLFAIALVLGFFLISIGFKYSGLLAKIIMVLGIGAVIKGFIFLKGNLSEKVIAWINKQPLVVFRAWAGIYILLGLLLILGLKG